ncbi:hypothetical protein KIQ14_004618 [Salmonella enterica]|nr:hypothetical protein [Salmonella enterica]
MEKRQRRILFPPYFSFVASYMLHPVLPAASARRSRTTERSESVSEEAEYILYRTSYLRADAAFFLLPHEALH